MANQHLLLRYTQALMTQMAQTAACNKHHSLDQQLCRWLLLSLEGSPCARLRRYDAIVGGSSRSYSFFTTA
jgi:hypothetical protein